MTGQGPSREWLIDEEAGRLIAKLAAETASGQDRTRLQELSYLRSRLMLPDRPRPFPRRV